MWLGWVWTMGLVGEVGVGWAGCGFSRNIRNNPTICEQYSLPTPVIHVYHPPCQPFPCPTFPRPPLRVATPARLLRQPFRDSYQWARSGDHSRWKCTGGRFAGMVSATELHHSHQNHSDIPLPASKSLFRLTKSLILISIDRY